MREQRIACGQFRAVAKDVDANLTVIEAQIAEAARRGCSVVVFPEMAVTGYLPPADLLDLAEPVDGRFMSRIASFCKARGIAAVVGFPELDPSRAVRHNSFAFVSGAGEIVGVYRKVHLWGGENDWAEAGTDVPVFDVDGTKYSGWICFDTRFPELARLAFLGGAEVCFVPTAWLGPAAEWELALRSRALDNGCFVAGSDVINDLPGLECRGHSMIVGPHGEILARARPRTECVIDAVLEPQNREQQRDRLRIAECRRPTLYRALSDPPSLEQ